MDELLHELNEKFVEISNIKETGEVFRYIEYDDDFVVWLKTKVNQVEAPVICSEAKSLCEPKYTEREILTAIRMELTKAFEEDSNPEDLNDKIYTTQGYVVCALKNFASKPEPNGI